MNKIPSTLTKNQAIAFAVVAFNNFINCISKLFSSNKENVKNND